MAGTMTTPLTFSVGKQQITPVKIAVAVPPSQCVGFVRVLTQIHYTNEVGVKYGEAKISYYYTIDDTSGNGTDHLLTITQVICINYPTGVFTSN